MTWCRVIEILVGSSPDGIHVSARDGRGVHVLGLTHDDARWLAAKLLEEVARVERVAPGTRRTAPPPVVAGVEEPRARRAGR